MFKVIKGGEFFKDGELDFRTPKLPPQPFYLGDQCYRTRFGPCFDHDGIILGNSDHNMQYAFRRLSGARFHDQPGRHDAMKNQQRLFIKNSGDYLDTLCGMYTPYFTEYGQMEAEAQLHHADPHPKCKLRAQAWDELITTGRLSDRLWLKHVTYKLKKDEIAKPGKPMRMIGDLGVAASLQGFRLTHYLKQAQAGSPLHYKGGSMHFIKSPSPFVLKEVFTKLLNPPGRYYMVIFSDDACIGIRGEDGVDVYNIDISKCDASHTEALFEALIRITPPIARDDMERVAGQCELPIHLHSTQDKSRKCVLLPKHALLYSGSTLTTAINNLANYLIGKAIADCVYKGPSSLIDAASLVGYVITLEKCEVIEDIQFLKHSPVFDTTGALQPMMNLGVLLRLSGVCRGDLPGRGDLETRGRQFQGALLAGAYPYCDFEILNRMKANTLLSSSMDTRKIEQTFEYKVVKEKYPHFTAEPASLYRRYRLTPLDIASIEDGCSGGYGSHFCGHSVDLILGKDYGLRSTPRE